MGRTQRGNTFDAVDIIYQFCTDASTSLLFPGVIQWAPCVYFVIEGLRNLGIPKALTSANQIKEAWLNTCYLAYNETGYMYEKYNAFEIGQGGGGGEYTPQIGFGWSNGIVHNDINFL